MWKIILGSVSNDVFERRTSTGSEAFSLFICLDANKFVLLSFFSLIKTIYQRVSTKPLPNDAKSPLPVDVRRSKTPLLKLPNIRGQELSANSFGLYKESPWTSLLQWFIVKNIKKIWLCYEEKWLRLIIHVNTFVYWNSNFPACGENQFKFFSWISRMS